MTTGRWGLGATLLAAAIVAVVVLPPRPIPEQYGFAASVLGFSYSTWYGGSGGYTWTVSRTRNRLAEAIAARPHGAADVRASRGPLALRSTREPVAVVRDPDVPIDIAREWLRDAEAELAAYPRAASAGVPVIIGLHTAKIFPGNGWHPSYLAARFLYAEGRDTACIADIVFSRNEGARTSKQFWHLQPRGWDDRRIGRCAMYARYGVAGTDVRAWYGLPPRWHWTNDAVLRVELVRRDAPRRALERDAEWWGYGGLSSSLACLNSGVGCSDIFRLAQGREVDDVYSNGIEALLIANLLRSRGPDRFTRFWRSSLPAESALQNVYGVSGGELARQAWLRRVTPPSPAGAHRGAAGTTVVWLAGILGLAMVLSRRQTMGV